MVVTTGASMPGVKRPRSDRSFGSFHAAIRRPVPAFPPREAYGSGVATAEDAAGQRTGYPARARPIGSGAATTSRGRWMSSQVREAAPPGACESVSAPAATEPVDAGVALPLALTLAILALTYWCVDTVSPALPVMRDDLGLTAT